jgi:hypothetical protein
MACWVEKRQNVKSLKSQMPNSRLPVLLKEQRKGLLAMQKGKSSKLKGKKRELPERLKRRLQKQPDRLRGMPEMQHGGLRRKLEKQQKKPQRLPSNKTNDFVLYPSLSPVASV